MDGADLLALQKNRYWRTGSRLSLDAGRVAMVGDDPASDVAGAQAAGLLGIQVKTGKYEPEEAGEADLLVESFVGLPEALRA